MISKMVIELIIILFCLGMSIANQSTEQLRQSFYDEIGNRNIVEQIVIRFGVEILILGVTIGSYLVPFNVAIAFFIFSFSVLGQYIFYFVGILYLVLERLMKRVA